MRASLVADRSSIRSADRASGPISMQQPHHVGVRAAVQRTLQRADRADDRRMQIGERRGRDARGERRRVQLVIRVQHERDVERARRQRVGPVARSACRGSSPRGRAPDPAGSGRRPPAAGRRSRPGSPAAPSAGRPCGSSPRDELSTRPGRSGRAPTSASAAHPCRPTAGQLLHEPQHRLRPSGRAAASCDCRSPSSARFGSRRARGGSRLPRTTRPGQVVDVVAVVREHAAVAVEVTDGGGRGDDSLRDRPWASRRWSYGIISGARTRRPAA